MIRSTHTGTINLGGGEPVSCYVLEDGQRVLVASQIQGVLGAGKDRHLGRILSRLPSDSEALDVRPVSFVSPGGPAKGYTASDVMAILKAFTRAFRAGALHEKQVPMAVRAIAALEACAEVGLAALIDEATGYEKERPEGSMAAYFDKVFAKTLGDWELLFDPEWDRMLCKLYGHKYQGRPPRFVGGINHMVYLASFGEPVTDHLGDINPNPSHGHNHHQFLTDEAKRVLSNTIATFKGLIRTSRSPKDFLQKVDVVFKGAPLQLEF